jgi:hypothetical protein
MSDWPFFDSENTAVFTTEGVVSNRDPILYVSHDLEDEAWQFHSGVELRDAVPKVVALRHIVQLDNSVKALADLPKGWIATRESFAKSWQRSWNSNIRGTV